MREVRSQLEAERADREEIKGQLTDREVEIAELRSELADLKQKSATVSLKIPDAGEVLNRLKAKRQKEEEAKTSRKKSLPALPTLTDIETILAMIEES